MKQSTKKAAATILDSVILDLRGTRGTLDRATSENVEYELRKAAQRLEVLANRVLQESGPGFTMARQQPR